MRNTITFILVVMGTLVSGVRAAQDQPAQPRNVEITAKKYEFDVTRIEMRVGETVELTLKSLDAKHGFECNELGIKRVTFENGNPASIAFTATKAGTYEFKCANFCGLGHGKMKGQIIVSP